MNREQMINHLTLHGWIPAKNPEFWIGVGSESHGLVYFAPVSDRVLHANSYYFELAEEFEGHWGELPDSTLAKIFNFIIEKGLT